MSEPMVIPTPAAGFYAWFGELLASISHVLSCPNLSLGWLLMAGEPADAEEDAKWWRHKRSSGVSAEYSRPSSAASIRSVRSSVRPNRAHLSCRDHSAVL